MGLVPFSAAPADKFDAQKHRAHAVDNPPADALVAETLAPGMTYQGRLVRPALVRLHEAMPPAATPTPETTVAVAAETPAETTEAAEPGQLALETDSN